MLALGEAPYSMMSLFVLVLCTICKAFFLMSSAMGTCLVRFCSKSTESLLRSILTLLFIVTLVNLFTTSSSSSKLGYFTSIFSRNLSTWASGSGYVPSMSIGFCVANTKNGCSSWNVWLPMVTCFSCMASSRADWVFGVALLISSARTMFANMGPFWNLNTFLLPSSSMR